VSATGQQQPLHKNKPICCVYDASWVKEKTFLKSWAKSCHSSTDRSCKFLKGEIIGAPDFNYDPVFFKMGSSCPQIFLFKSQFFFRQEESFPLGLPII